MDKQQAEPIPPQEKRKWETEVQRSKNRRPRVKKPDRGRQGKL